jgi:hypothetical protein
MSAEVEVKWAEEGPLYIDLRAHTNSTHGAVLKAFRTPPDGEPCQAEADGAQVGDVLVGLNAKSVETMLFMDIIGHIKSCEWPLTMRFRRPVESKRRSWGDMLSVPGKAISDAVGKESKENVPSNSSNKKVGALPLPTSSMPFGSGATAVRRGSLTSGWGSLKDKMSIQGLRESMSSIGGSTVRSAANEERELEQLLESVKLIGGPHHTDLIVAKASDASGTERYIGGAGDKGKLSLSWHRATSGGKFMTITDVQGGFYQPSADDIGAHVCLKVHLTSNEELSSYSEVGPITVDPKLLELVEENMRDGEARFAVTLRSAPKAKHFLICDTDRICLCRCGPLGGEDAGEEIVGNDRGMESEERGEGEEGGEDDEEEAEVLVHNAYYNERLQVLLDPVNVCCFGVSFATTSTADGGAAAPTSPGAAVGETEEEETTGDRYEVETEQLLTDSARTRDVIALTIREMRKAAIGDEREEVAVGAELDNNLKDVLLLQQEQLAAATAAAAAAALAINNAVLEEEDDAEEEDAAATATAAAAAAALGISTDLGASEELKLEQLALLRAKREANEQKREGLQPLVRTWDELVRSRQLLQLELRVLGEEKAVVSGCVTGEEGGVVELEGLLTEAREHKSKQEHMLSSASAEAMQVKRQLVEVSESCQVAASQLLASQEKVRYYEATNEGLHKDCTSLTATLEELDEDGLRRDVSNLKDKVKAAEAELKERRQELTARMGECLQMTKEVQEVGRESTMARSKIQIRSSKLDEQLEKIGRLERELVQRESDGTFASTQQAQRMQARVSGALSDLERVRVDMKEAASARDAVHDQLSASEEKAAAEEARVTELKDETTHWKEEAEKMQQDLKRLLKKGDLGNIEKRLARREQMAVDLKAELETVKSSKSDLVDYQAALAGLRGKGAKGAKGEESTVVERARAADGLLERHHSLEVSVAMKKDKLKTQEFTLQQVQEVNREMVRRIESLEAQLDVDEFKGSSHSQHLPPPSPAGGKDMVRVRVSVGADTRDTYSMRCEKSMPVSWLLSEVIRQHTEKKSIDDPGIVGLIIPGEKHALDLCENIGRCLSDGDRVKAVLM